MSQRLTVSETTIPGLVVLNLPVHGDNRGWFKENWQREKMVALGLPDFGPVQNNISFNAAVGTTRGIHAEPWDKFISVAAGRIFGAWVDLRRGPTFGRVFTSEVDASRAVFVPRGVGNAFQTLEENTSYTYLVNDHWSANAKDQYAFLNLADETVDIRWPVPLGSAELSENDRAHPRLVDVNPVEPKKTLVLGANGQLGRALRDALKASASVDFATRSHFDLSKAESVSSYDWSRYSTVINAAAYTAVDAAESTEGRRHAWATNVAGVAALARVASEHRITLVHVSSDYVFDGQHEIHGENEGFSPLSVYGQTKAAGDSIVETVPQHYIVRTSWVVGEGPNFVCTMVRLAEANVSPRVVNDQTGRLTFAEDLAGAILHLLASGAPFGTYNVTNSGKPQTWADIAADIYEMCGNDRNSVSGVSTAAYFADKPSFAPRPLNSTLDLAKIGASGYIAPPASWRLEQYVSALLP